MWRLKGLPWIWMTPALSRGWRSTWVFLGVCAVSRAWGLHRNGPIRVGWRRAGVRRCRLAMWHFLARLPGYVNVQCWAEHCSIVGTLVSICGKSAGQTAGSMSDCKIGRCAARRAGFLDRCSCVLRTDWALSPSGRGSGGKPDMTVEWPQRSQHRHNKSGVVGWHNRLRHASKVITALKLSCMFLFY